jgi:hypothetical protein
MKKFRDILGDMASWMVLSGSKVTNFTIGSVIRSLLESVAMEIEDLYFFIKTKFDEFQDKAIYASFNFERRPAQASTGIVTLRFTQPISQTVLIPKGFRYFTSPIEGKTVYFEVIEDTIASLGFSEIDTMVKCTETGLVGNVPAYSITKTVNATPFMSGVVNKDKFFTGLPEEGKEERQKRFNSFIASLGKSTQPAVAYGCMQVKGLAGVYIKEDIGMIYVYAHDHFGNLSEDMKLDIEEKLYDYKAGGIKAIISGVIKKLVDLEVQVLIADGYDKTAILYKVEEEVAVYLNKLLVSKPLIRADLIRFIMEIDKESIQNVSLSIQEDFVIEPQELIRPGIVTIREMV